VTLLKIADRVRLGDHEAATSLTAAQLDSMIDLVSAAGEERARLAGSIRRTSPRAIRWPAGPTRRRIGNPTPQHVRSGKLART
jgi:hypothetical protein